MDPRRIREVFSYLGIQHSICESGSFKISQTYLDGLGANKVQSFPVVAPKRSTMDNSSFVSPWMAK